MGVEARALVLVSAVLLAFGLAVLYSASALLAVQEGHGSACYFLARSSLGALHRHRRVRRRRQDRRRTLARLGVAADAASAIVLLLIPVLPFMPASIAPRIHGSRRWLNVGVTFQPSEFAKLARASSGRRCSS